MRTYAQYAQIYNHIHINVHTYAHIQILKTHRYAHTHTYTHNTGIYTHVPKHVIYIHPVSTCIHTYTQNIYSYNTYTHAFTHTHIYPHAHTPEQKCHFDT